MFALANEQCSLLNNLYDFNKLSPNQYSKFLTTISNNFDITSFISDHFYSAYYKTLGADRDFSLESVLAACIFKHLFNIDSTEVLILFLALSKEVREDFCHFASEVPTPGFFSKFIDEFEPFIRTVFDNLVVVVLEIFSKLDASLPSDSPLKGLSNMLIYDTSAAKPFVKENNPKYINHKVNEAKKSIKKYNNNELNPFAVAYSNLPKVSKANPSIKLTYANGHMGYFYSFGLITNGFGIPLDITFLDELALADSVVSPTSIEQPSDLKYILDNASLSKVVAPFVAKYHRYKFSSFLGDSEFDSHDNFALLKHLNFDKVFIPINARNSATINNSDLAFNSDGVPLCPVDKTPFKSEGSCKGKSRSFRLKFICHKAGFDKSGKRTCSCESPCSKSNCGRAHYVYPNKDFRLYPGLARNSDEWKNTYKVRAIIERELSSFKSNMCVARPKSLRLSTIKASIFFSGIASLLKVIVANAISKPEFMRNTKLLIKAA